MAWLDFWMLVLKGDKGFGRYKYRCHACGQFWEDDEPPEICPKCGAKNGIAYLCDPELNEECRKTGCYIHGGECKMTLHPEYAAKERRFPE